MSHLHSMQIANLNAYAGRGFSLRGYDDAVYELPSRNRGLGN